MTSVLSLREVYDPKMDTFRRFLGALCDFEKSPGLGSASELRAKFRVFTDVCFTSAADRAEMREDLEEIIGSRLEKNYNART